MNDMLCVGEIVNTHGIKGELKVIPLLNDSNDLKNFSNVIIDGKSYAVESVRFQNEIALIKLKGIDDKTLGDRYKGKFLELSRSELKPLDKDNYYICDLLGLKVIDEALGELGTVKDIIQTGSNDAYVIDYLGKPLCIPIIEGVVKDIDMEVGCIKVVLPKGLI